MASDVRSSIDIAFNRSGVNAQSSSKLGSGSGITISVYHTSPPSNLGCVKSKPVDATLMHLADLARGVNDRFDR